MPAVHLYKNSFVSGELSPGFYGRTDHQKFHSGATVMRNMFVNYRGGSSSRAGLAFCGASRQGGLDLPPRLIRFRFSITQQYVLEFGHRYMRVIQDGGYITEATLAVSAILTGAATTITVPGSSFGAGDQVFLSSLPTLPLLDSQIFTIGSAIGTSYTLLDLFGDPVDSSGSPAYPGGAQAGRIFTLVTPYAAADLPYMKPTQSADVMSIDCVNTQTGSEYPPYDLARLAANSWTLTQTTFGSPIPAPTGVFAYASADAEGNPTQYAYVVTAVNKDGIESIASVPAYIFDSVNIANTLGTITVIWNAVAGAIYYNIYKAPPSFSAVVPIGAVFGFAGTCFGTQWIDNNVTQDLTVTPPLHINPFARGAVQAVTMTATGSGYTQGYVQAVVNTSTGAGAVLDPIVVNGEIQGVVVENGGSGYAPSDTISFVGAPISGAILNPTITAAGTGYENPFLLVNPHVPANFPPNPATDPWGAAIGVSQKGSGLSNLNQINPGQNYPPGTTIDVRDTAGGAGSGATVGFTLGTKPPGTGATADLTIGPQTGTYPSVVSYFQSRRIHASTLRQPDTYFMSKTGSYNNMDASTPPVDNDAITGTPWAQQVDGIQWLLPMPGGLIIGTGQDAWQLSGAGGSGSPVTPSSQSAQPQESNGFNPLVPPIKINYDIIYLQSLGAIVRDIQYNFFTNIYAGNDISFLSNHLFEGFTVREWDWAKEPYKIVWAVRSDGKFLSLTYLKEQEVVSWARHDTNGLVVSVACISEPPVDTTYMVVRRYVPGKARWMHYIERMDDRLWRSPEDVFAVDAGLALTQPQPAATLSATEWIGPGHVATAHVIAGGHDYVNPEATVTGNGLGATISLQVTGGVITGATVTNPGAGYSTYTVTVKDVGGSGAGAVLTLLLDQNITFTANAAVFSAQNLGSVIRMGGGRATITAVLGTTQVRAAVTAPIAATMPNDPNRLPVPAPAGSWTMTAPVTVLNNLRHLEGFVVSVVGDGSVQQQKVVRNGSITLDQPASQVVVGLPYVAQLQSLHTDVPGPVSQQGNRMAVSSMSVRMEASRGVQLGANQPIAAMFEFQPEYPWTDMQEIKDHQNAITAGAAVPLFTGDRFVNISDNWNLPPLQGNGPAQGMVAMMQVYPMPMNILAVGYDVEFGDTGK